MEPLFRTDAGSFLPSEHTRGPWDERAQHAGPPAALMGRALEGVASDVPMHVARFTLELLRPIPLVALQVAVSVERPGRRVQMLRAVLRSAAGDELAVAHALRIRAADIDLPGAGDPAALLRGPNSLTAHQAPDAAPAFHMTGVELRFEQGAFELTGPAAVWIRLRHPLVDDEEPSALQRTLAAADFGNGVSALLDWRRFLFINPDLTVSCARPATGEWICLEATSQLSPHGTGLAHSRLHDQRGPFGHALQSLLVDRLPERAGG